MTDWLHHGALRETQIIETMRRKSSCRTTLLQQLRTIGPFHPPRLIRSVKRWGKGCGIEHLQPRFIFGKSQDRQAGRSDGNDAGGCEPERTVQCCADHPAMAHCTSNCWDNSTSVCSPRMAASATFALKAGLWFRRGRLVVLSPVPASKPKSGRNSTYPRCSSFTSQFSCRWRWKP